jgi:hypothetical protein
MPERTIELSGPAEAQGVSHHQQAAHRHGTRRDYRRNEPEGRQGDRDEVVDKRPG